MKTPYSYTILRYVHDVATGEFVNVGVAIYSKEARYAGAMCRTTYGRVSKTFPGVDGESFRGLMRFIQSRVDEIGFELAGELPLNGLPDSVLEVAHRVLPADDSSLQWSPPGSGLADDLPATLERLFERMVMRYEDRPQQESRTDDAVWRKFRRTLESRHLLRHLESKTISVSDDELEFQHAWKNGIWHCLEPISFDLASPDSIRDKAHRWLGQVSSIKDSPELFKIYLLLGEPQRAELRPAFDQAMSILGKLPVKNEVVRESDAASFSEEFAREIESHEKGSGE